MAAFICSKDSIDEIPLQGLIVISCANNTPNNQFIQKILKHFNSTTDQNKEYKPKTLNFGTDVDINCFDLNIDNKYYSADILLFDIRDKHLFDKRFEDSVNGVIIYFDAEEETSFEDVMSWNSFVDRFENQIKLLICRTIDDKYQNKRQVIEKWCLDNEFELVELCPQLVVDEENDIPDIDGMTRLCQAIEAHHWPNSTLKERLQYNPSPHFKDLISKELDNRFDNSDNNSDDNQTNADQTDQLQDIQQMEEFEDFDKLFEKFSEMKVKSSQLNETERKSYAEKVTIAFWKAIGGDVDEIEGLEDEKQ